MSIPKAFTAALVLGCLVGGAYDAYAQNATIKTSKIYRRTQQNGEVTRPRVPAYRDYLTYTVVGTLLDVAYPSNALPATVTVSGAESGFVLYTTTALREEPIDLPLQPGDYTLTVTLVDERTYEGPLEINTAE